MTNPKQWNPGELLEISGHFWKTAVLHTAVKLEIFTVIGEHSLAASEISQKLDGAHKGVIRLLDALVAMELFVKTDNQ